MFRLKALAAAVLVAFSGAAAAAIDTGATSDGELFAVAYDATARVTYLHDLSAGMLTNPSFSTFNPTSATTPGLSRTWNLPDWSSFQQLVTGTVRWGVFAIDRLAPTAVFTTLTSTTAEAGNLARLNGINSALNNFLNVHNLLPSHSTLADGNSLRITAAADAVTDLGFFNNIVGTNFAFGPGLTGGQAVATLGASLFFGQFGAGPTTGSVCSPGACSKDIFDNSFGNATWTLSDAGVLTYSAPIPEPGTYALMLAGLVAVGAIARRRSRRS